MTHFGVEPFYRKAGKALVSLGFSCRSYLFRCPHSKYSCEEVLEACSHRCSIQSALEVMQHFAQTLADSHTQICGDVDVNVYHRLLCFVEHKSSSPYLDDRYQSQDH